MGKIFKITIFLTVAFLIFQFNAAAQGNFFDVKDQEKEYQTIINTKELADPIFEKIRGYFYYNLGLQVGWPYVLDLVTPQYLDQLAPPQYRGVEIGLYTFEGTFHHIYVLNNLAVDDFIGVASHEFAHAWQAENCPSNQSLVLKEGFADWVAYKVLQFDGAVNNSQGIFYRSDPVYGQGFKIMIQLEDQGGIPAVISYVKTAVE